MRFATMLLSVSSMLAFVWTPLLRGTEPACDNHAGQSQNESYCFQIYVPCAVMKSGTRPSYQHFEEEICVPVSVTNCTTQTVPCCPKCSSSCAGHCCPKCSRTTCTTCTQPRKYKVTGAVHCAERPFQYSVTAYQLITFKVDCSNEQDPVAIVDSDKECPQRPCAQTGAGEHQAAKKPEGEHHARKEKVSPGKQDGQYVNRDELKKELGDLKDDLDRRFEELAKLITTTKRSNDEDGDRKRRDKDDRD